jgi:hypothetical protein
MNINYIAGFFDGEGCVLISKRKAKVAEKSTYGFYLVPNIIMVQKELKVLEDIRDFLNLNNIGCFIKCRNSDKCFQLVIGGAKRCLKFCDLFTELTYVKKEQLKLMHKFIESRLSLPPKTPYSKYDFELVEEITRLKHIKVA